MDGPQKYLHYGALWDPPFPLRQHTRRTVNIARSLLLLAIPFYVGCADGGETEVTQSSIQVADQHYVWGLNSPTSFVAFPIQATEIVPAWGSFTLSSNSQYQISLNGSTGVDGYSIDDTGELSVFVVPSSRAPTIRYLGAYGIEGDTGVYYFTDRYTTSASNNLGMFWGTRIVTGPADMEHGWHFFSQHIVFGNSLDVGRAVAGRIDIDDQGVITGSGTESTRVGLTFGGQINSFGDSRVDLTIDYIDSQSTDTRVFLASAGERITITTPRTPKGPKPAGGHTSLGAVGTNLPPDLADKPVTPWIADRYVPHLALGIDADTSDGEAGLVAMVAVRTDAADPALLEGSYHAGVHTVFVDVTNPGTDTAAGKITFDKNGAFNFTGTGAGGVGFSYDGSYLLAADGKITLTISGTGETWIGAVDQDYQNVIIADNFVEQRTGAKPPELNLFIGIREATP